MHNYYKNKRILVTGGCGFIGSNLTIRLVKLGAEVTIADSMIPNHGGNLFNLDPVRNQVQLSFTDMRDPYAMKYLVSDKDIIFNLAGQVSHIDSMHNPFQDLEINTVSQLQLLELCRKYNSSTKIVLTSTRQVYGIPATLPVTETHITCPVDVNGINILSGEHYHLLYYRAYQIPTVILRLTNTYGPRQLLKDTNQGLTGTFIYQALTGNTIEIFGDGEQKRDFNYVDDVIEALLISGYSDKLLGNIYNLGSDPPHSLKEFVFLLNQLCEFDHKLVPFPEDKKKIDIGDYFSDYSKFREDSGWEPKIELKEGLRRTIDFYRQHSQYIYH